MKERALNRTDPHEVRSAEVGELPARWAPSPHTVAETGLGELYLGDLLSKHLYEEGVLDLRDLAERMALSGTLLEEVLAFLRSDARVEVLGRAAESGVLRFGLTDRGRAAALEASARDGYVGPAPVSLEQYAQTVVAQSVRGRAVTRDDVHATFADTVIRPELLDQLGPALHSGRAMFIYGAPGTGKSFIARRLARLLRGAVLIPHAIVVSGKAVRCFDPVLHKPADSPATESALQFDHGRDRRFVLCRRPVVITGGELALDMLDIQYDEATRTHRAPLQLRANNGMLLIDDLGRQRVDPSELFNRWIIPLEEQRDFLTLKSGQHFQVPFDTAVVFSTNRNPLELADEAFLRRIGYKIRFEYLSETDYADIWQQECRQRGVEYEPELVRFTLDELHARHEVPLLPCHPRDLIDLATDFMRYLGEMTLTQGALRWAWDNYFVRLD